MKRYKHIAATVEQCILHNYYTVSINNKAYANVPSHHHSVKTIFNLESRLNVFAFLGLPWLFLSPSFSFIAQEQLVLVNFPQQLS